MMEQVSLACRKMRSWPLLLLISRDGHRHRIRYRPYKWTVSRRYEPNRHPYRKGQTQIPLRYGTVPSYGRKRYTAHIIPLGGPGAKITWYRANLEVKEHIPAVQWALVWFLRSLCNVFVDEMVGPRGRRQVTSKSRSPSLSDPVRSWLWLDRICTKYHFFVSLTFKAYFPDV